MARFAVIGAGAWGTALACHVARLGHAVTMWAFESEVATEITEAHANSPYLPEVRLPESIAASTDAGAVATGADVVLLVPPSQHLRRVTTGLSGRIAPHAVVIVATKGIEERSLKLMSEVLAETLPEVGASRVVFLSGPSFAREVARGLPTDVVLASRELQTARALQPLLHAPTFRTYASADPIGVQVGGALKNVIAVATGACDGLEFGPNARAALVTRGLAEITRIGVALGANPLTFLGMSGVGDLILTCTGDQSRNRTLGKEVARGADPLVYLSSQRAVAEGFHTAAAGYALAQKLGVEAPITENVYHVLHRGRPIAEAVTILMERAYRDELDGIELR